MAVEQTILFTIVPRAVSISAATHPVSVVVSPRLDGADYLGAFPDWVRWTRLLLYEGLKLELLSGTRRQIFSIDTAGLRPDLWEQLFNAETYVRSHQSFDDYSERGLISFSVRDTLSALKAVYQEASVTLALPDAPATRRVDDRRTKLRFKQPPSVAKSNRQRLQDLIEGLQVHWDGREARARRREVSHSYSSTERRNDPAGPLDSEGLLIGKPSADEMREITKPFSVFHHMPTPKYGDNVIELPDRAKLIDFHQALTTLNAYPELRQALGLVFDLELPRDFLAATSNNKTGTLEVARALPGWESAMHGPTRPLQTAYVKIAIGNDELFLAAPRSIVELAQPGTVFGLLDLDPAHFGIAQVDVDGAMHKAIMLAETIHPSGEHNLVADATPQEARHPDIFDPEATLPSLRSGGFSLFADNRALQLLQSIQDAKKFNVALADPKQPSRPLYAEDLVRGYRLDVWDSRTNGWHSLHQRRSSYTVGDAEFNPLHQPEEGFVELAATQAAPGAINHDRELYLHEAIARWSGWSLSLPRPGKHLSRYPDAKDAIPRPDEGDKFAENQPETPFRIAARHDIVPGSLPPLRFGVRYRLRARVVDLAGHSLRVDDKFTDALAGIYALPRDPEGFAYLRFEPVPAPLVVIREEASVTAPGSAVDRLVIRTFNDDISKDGVAADTSAADRHIVQPRASLEMGERLGAFDDVGGKLKSDAATWKLIADRDLGELRKKAISLKGRADPLPADGSNEYPVEPGERIDALPYFPDPLSRGAALRDLPGTPSGTLGRVVPDTGTAARVDYPALSDPNPRAGSVTLISFGESGDWEKTRGFRLALAEPKPDVPDEHPDWDPLGRVLTVYLPKAHQKVVPLSSYLNPDDLKLMGVWQWLRQYIDKLTVSDVQAAHLQPGSDLDRIAHVLQRAVEGGHWMLTPPHLLTLVHAVQQPIGRPEFTAAAVDHDLGFDSVALQTTPGRGRSEPGKPGRSRSDPTELAAITAWRRPASTEAYLLGALKIHAASTGRIDLLATWDDPVDDVSLKKWTTAHHAAPVDEVTLPVLDDAYLGAAGALPQFPRQVGYYDSAHDQILFVRRGDNTTWLDYSFEDAAPRHVIGDTKHHVVSYTATATSRFREYFDPKLLASAFTRGSVEPVLVDVPASARPLPPDIVYVVPTFGWERQVQTNLKRSVRFGGGLRVYLSRPWFSSGIGELLGVALWSSSNGVLDDATRDKFKPFFTQWGMDPIWRTGGLIGAPSLSDFPDADDADSELCLDEDLPDQPPGSKVRVSVAGFAPQYDEVRQLWFADLTINLPSETYMPFVRLALVRYQPHALADAKISRVVLADFAQLTPDRSAMVTADPHHPHTVRVVVSGVAPRRPSAVIASFLKQALPLPPHVLIGVRVQRRDATLDSDLNWIDVGPDVAGVIPLKDGTVEGHPDLVIWAGIVQFVHKPVAGAYRLLVEEHELISAEYTEAVHNTVRQPSRLVYAEIFELDTALLSK